MNKLVTGLLAGALAASFAVAAAAPTAAAPLPAFSMKTLAPAAAQSDVTNVDYVIRRPRHWRGGDRHWRGGRDWRGDRGGYWRGHYGSRHWRPGYRRHGDFWFPLAAFATGAIISGAIANDAPPAYRSGDAHVRWCYNRYRSYRASDNTYQPYNGPRRQCYSPY